MQQKRAIAKINKAHALLVFPVNNAAEPRSLWTEFFPRKKMLWQWDDNGDDSVAQLWHLMKALSDCRKVIYSKWYQGRATFFSQDCFRAMLCLQQQLAPQLSRSARDILDILEEESPLSTKVLKKQTGLQGRLNEATYNKALKELFQKMLVVAFGEVDDGAFPSLAVGATKNLYEELWFEAQAMEVAAAEAEVAKFLGVSSKFSRFFAKTLVR